MNTSVHYKLAQIEDAMHDNEILYQFGYEEYDPENDNYNYSNDVKRIGDEDVWLLRNPIHDEARVFNIEGGAGAISRGIVENTAGTSYIFDSANSAHHAGDLYVEEIEDTSADTQLLSDDQLTSYDVFDVNHKEVQGFDSNFVTSERTIARYEDDDTEIRVDREYFKDYPPYSVDWNKEKFYLAGGNVVTETFRLHDNNTVTVTL